MEIFFPMNDGDIFEESNGFVWKLSFLWLIGNKTSCRPIRSVIILVLLELFSFCYHEVAPLDTFYPIE